MSRYQSVNMSGKYEIDPELEEVINATDDFARKHRASQETNRRAAAGAGGGRSASPSRGRSASPSRGRSASPSRGRSASPYNGPMEEEMEAVKNTPGSYLHLDPKFPSPEEFMRREALYRRFHDLKYKAVPNRRMRLRKTASKRKSKTTRSQYAVKKKSIKSKTKTLKSKLPIKKPVLRIKKVKIMIVKPVEKTSSCGCNSK
jgi:hypothetical protein